MFRKIDYFYIDLINMFSFAQNISVLPYVFLLITYLGGITAISINIASGDVALSSSNSDALVSIIQQNQINTFDNYSNSDILIKAQSTALIQSVNRKVFVPYRLLYYNIANEVDKSHICLMSYFSRPPPKTTL